MTRRRERPGRNEPRAAPHPSGRPWLRQGLGAALLLALGWWAALLWPGALRPAQDAAVAGVAPASVQLQAFRQAGGGVEVAPADGGADILLIVYGGGLVRPQAYAWLGVNLAPVGVRTLIPAFPLDLAALGRGRAGALLERLGDGERRVVLAGHSLGGAMAAAWAEGNRERLDGLILLGAYPGGGVDLRDADLPTLVLAAEHDGVAAIERVREGLQRLPANAGVETVAGAVHAFFGRYGPQRGDGTPTVPRATAEAEIAASVEAFVLGLR